MAKDSFAVTSLPASPEVDRNKRFKQYTIAMAIRTLCVVLMVTLPNPWFWLAALGAIFLPYFAVVIANTGGSPVSEESFEPYLANSLTNRE